MAFDDLEVQEAQALLRRIAGPAAVFRDGQLEAIEALVSRRERALVVQRTGWGKSAVYFIATRMLRDRTAGPTLLVSPLLVLMRNQIEMATRGGVLAATINSSNREEWDAIEGQIRSGQVDLLLISPERLNNQHFRGDVMPELAKSVGLLVVDEAHCISDWGHDFRPDYRRIARVLDRLPSGVPVLCTTATANERVIEDIRSQLGSDLTVIRGTLDRESLALDVVILPTQAERLAWLATVVPTLPGSGIVYCLTVRDTKIVATWLQRQEISAVAYSGGTDDGVRLEVEAALAANEVKVVVATSALGMGYDKPDVAFVIHYQSPGSPIAYYQQVGRAGRALEHSEGILLAGAEDKDIQDWFIETAFPPEPAVNAVLDLLSQASQPLKSQEILGHVNVRRTRLDGMLKILEVEGAVEWAASGGWRRTARPWAYDRARVEHITAARRAEQAAMVAYLDLDRCLMEHLRLQLDDPLAAPCGRCSRCTGRDRSVHLDRDLVVEAAEYLRSRPITIEPRKRWERPKSGAIPDDRRVEQGRGLSIYGDGGWGSVVRSAKYETGAFPPELVAAAVGLIGGWAPHPEPTWLTWVPSTSSTLVADAAQSLAAALGIPAIDAVRRVRPGRPQKAMENSAQQLANVYRAFEVSNVLPTQPVLLIDDIADSRWTITVIGDLLRAAGSGAVYPFVFTVAVSS